MTQASPLMLAIDCSDRACSVALGNEQSLIEEFTDEPRQHAKKLLPMYRDLLARSSYQQEDIKAIAVASGPGSFTGLRIGFSFAQGLSFALPAPLIQISSLEALALSYIEATPELIEDKPIGQVQVCLDARMDELYVASFNLRGELETITGLERQCDDALIGIGNFDLSADYSTSALIGSGFALEGLSDLGAPLVASDTCIHASAVHSIGMRLFAEGEVSNAIDAEPVYLRRENAWKTVAQQRQAALEKKLGEKALSKKAPHEKSRGILLRD